MQKIEWVDSGKGFAIVLVVLVHAVDWLLHAGLGIPAWDGLNQVFATMRMPLFFLMSGLFARKWITTGWRQLAVDKLLFLYWVFLLWSVIGSFVNLVGMSLHHESTTPVNFIGALVLSPVRPRFELWFVWALALFFIAAKLMRNWHPAAQFAAAGTLAFLWQSGFISVNIGWDGAAKNYLFFLLGVTYKEVIFRTLERSSMMARIGVTLCWAALAVCLVTTPAGGVPGLRFLASLFGVVAGTAISSMLAGVGGLRYLGQRTLPIYVAHTPIVVLIAYGASFGIFDVLPTPVRAIAPLIVAAAAIALALFLHSWAVRGRMGWLYAPPSGLRKRLANLAIRH